MNRDDALLIIKEEELMNYRFFEDRPYKADEVVIDKKDDKWQVYVTSERCAVWEETMDEYDNESDALEDFIDRLQADKILREL